MSFIVVDNLCKKYKVGELSISAIDNINFTIEKGQMTLIVGASGAGKTTFLNILGGIDSPSSGKLIVDGNDISTYSNKQLTNYRRNEVGFVFQFYNLVPNLTAIENVELSTQICKNTLDPHTILCDVGLVDRINNFPAQLSGGEQQRVAIARALTKNPKLLLCDEPTGALDYQTSKSVLSLLQSMCHKMGMTVVIITHNAALTPIADKVIRFSSGKIKSVEVNQSTSLVEDVEW